MGRIAIFCDGTWNSPTIDQPTHVFSLFEATKATPEQRTVYLPGVGTGGKRGTFLGKTLNKVGGGAFGWGLNANIKQAYRAVAMLYRPDDEIMIFGFSRGAYTARSLAGMIRKCGIIDNPTAERINAAFDLYRLPGQENHPDAPHIIARRQAMSPRYATSDEDIAWRALNTIKMTDSTTPPPPDKIAIRFLGVWDTVGSLGMPPSILGPAASIWNRRYKFHDTKLSSSVKAARHAVALDERRIFFRPTLWDNLEETRDDPGLNKGDRGPARPYQQLWFIGTHSLVGGSALTRPLAGITLDWIAQGAREAGLELREDAVLPDAPPDAAVESDELLDASLIYRLAGSLLDWRRGPGHPIDLHASARDRIAARKDYRPLSLRGLMPELFGGKPLNKTSQDPDTAG
jgi:uncharacterized protein (DUF2235 family)